MKVYSRVGLSSHRLIVMKIIADPKSVLGHNSTNRSVIQLLHVQTTIVLYTENDTISTS